MTGTRLAYAAVVGGKTTPAAAAPPPVVVAAAAHPPIERTDRKTGSRHAQAPVAPAPIVSAWTAKTVANCSSGNAGNDAAAGKNLGAKEVIDSSTASYKSDLSERPELDDEKGRSREGEPENQSISKAAAPQKSKCDKEFLLRRQTSSRSMRSYLCNLAYRFSLNFCKLFLTILYRCVEEARLGRRPLRILEGHHLGRRDNVKKQPPRKEVGGAN